MIHRSHCVPARLLLPAALLLALAGCGGGGGRSANLAGIVSDIDGSAVAGAHVSVAGKSTTSLSNGTFALNGIRDGIQTVHADLTINGHRWSGDTAVDVATSEQNRSVNVVVSDERFQGGIGGRVLDQSGFGIQGAKVFVGGPISSTLAITDRDGYYEVGRLSPSVTYTVTASLAGFVNETRTVHVDPNLVSAASFVLTLGNSQGAIPAPANVVAQAWTVNDTVTRADSRTRSAYELLKRIYRRKHGLSDAPQARNIERRGQASRSWPLGSVIEVDLFWDFASFEDLFGYAIKRATSQAGLSSPGAVTAVARDPLTRVFFDADPFLTADTTYYYTVHRLDTIDFPAIGTIGPPSAVVNSTPLGPERALSPSQGAQVPGDPVFQWSSVGRAGSYTVYVWDHFPDLNSNTDPNGAAPIWTGSVNAPQTSLTYGGPVLQSGHTYYWMAVASSPGDAELSASEIRKFVAQ